MNYDYQFCRLDTVTLAYIEKGEGEPLILLHGNGENSEYFEYQIEFFSRYYRVIAVDSRGHGRSERGSGELTLQRIADDLFEFMNQLSIEKANLLGFSDGGNIALLFALKHQEKIRKLIVNGANLDTKGVLAVFQAGVVAGHALLSLPARKSPEANLKREILSLMIGQPDITTDELSSVAVPTLVLAGTHDVIKRKHTEKIFASLPDGRICLIKGGHAIARENPGEFNKTVLEFLTA
ncbi:MAG: alpha/beta hydrolase [Oscillospiraceae bacterium]|nr:alpha/beta hydrolase [Oscillospiraceae bacterium]